jgi:hypothetical protein
MTAPALKLTVTQRDRLRALQWEEWQVVTPGRAMLRRRGRLAGYCNVEELANTKALAERADTVCLSPADFADVQAWLRKDAA